MKTLLSSVVVKKLAGLGIDSLDCLVEVEKGLLNGLSLGIELTKQSIIVFITSAFPRWVRVSEVNLGMSNFSQCREFGTIIKSDRVKPVWGVINHLLKLLTTGFCSVIGNLMTISKRVKRSVRVIRAGWFFRRTPLTKSPSQSKGRWRWLIFCGRFSIETSSRFTACREWERWCFFRCRLSFCGVNQDS